MPDRREFLAATAALVPSLAWQAPSPGEWGTPVFDLHYHPRPDPAATIAHFDGAGITRGNLLTRASAGDQVKALQAAAPGRFIWFGSYDVSQPDAEQVLTRAIKAGAQGFGEMKFHVAADAPEYRRAYALAADLNVPLLIHFQEVDHFPNEGTWATGYAKVFEGILKAFPKTTFIGHADAFWANVSKDYHNEAAYPTGTIAPGGITDKLLADYPNLYGDLAANSGNNALSRDPDFTADFLRRHSRKLIFGSDCACRDGHGNGVSQSNNPAAARMSGKCVARETLGLLKRTVTPELFKTLTWDNAHALLRIPS
ncbi:MAG TPA: amidohydrolase family protein [Luteitalea sp.]|nr:amidohydrolase family protein [Luteitalea sp.]